MKYTVRRALAILLTLCLLAVGLPMSAAAADSSLPRLINVADHGVTWSSTTLEGTTITEKTFSAKTQVLIFFDISGVCSNSNMTLASVLQTDWIFNPNVQVVAVGCDSNNATASSTLLQQYINDNKLSTSGNVIFTWANNTFMKVYNYLLAAGVADESHLTFNFPVNVILSPNGNLRAAWMGSLHQEYYSGLLYELGVPGVTVDTTAYKLYDVQVPGTLDYSSAYAMLAMLNEYRKEEGRDELIMDQALLASAMQRSAEIALYYSHTRPNTENWYTVNNKSNRENIAVGYLTAEDVMDGWKGSAGHNDNILAADVKSVGIGSYIDNGGTRCWVQIFSKQTGTEPIIYPSGMRAETRTIKAAGKFLNLQPSVTELRLNPGGEAAVELRNVNLNWEYCHGRIVSSYYSTDDAAIAAIAANEDGSVTVTAKAVGKTTVYLGVLGDPHKTVKVNVTVAEEIVPPDPGPDRIIFGDVPSNAYFKPAVDWAIEHEITSGTDPGLFSPDDICTRAQAVTFLWRSAGRPEPFSKENTFTDVPDDEYYTTAVLWAVEKGILYGTDPGLFSPDDTCTRAQIAAFLHRLAGRPVETGVNPFMDVSNVDYFYEAVRWGEKNSIIYGTDPGFFSPYEMCTRAQIVTFLYRYLGK